MLTMPRYNPDRPIVAAMLIGYSGDPTRFATAAHYASYTAPPQHLRRHRRARLFDVVPGTSGHVVREWVESTLLWWARGHRRRSDRCIPRPCHRQQRRAPDAVLVIDQFHAIHLASEAVNDVRRRVQQDGGAPVDAACIFVLSTPFVFQAITDASGNWSLAGLPDDYDFAVAAVPPFTGTFGPCANDGPPPVPGPGELQPVFFDDIWIDLSDPDLVGGGDAYAYAIAHGAVSFSDTASGIESCLTTAPGTVVPRPACLQAPPTTTTTTVAPTTTTTTTTTVGPTSSTAPTTTADPATPPTLPATGSTSGPIGLAAATLVSVGVVTLLISRRRPHT